MVTRFVRQSSLLMALAASVASSDAGADVNARDERPDGLGRASGWTALHVAAHHGQWAIARQLLVRGADPNRKSDQGMMPSDMPGWAQGTQR